MATFRLTQVKNKGSILPWLIGRLFFAGDTVKTSDGNLWKAAIDNTGNDPSTDDGTNWEDAVSGVLGGILTGVVSVSKRAKLSNYSLTGSNATVTVSDVFLNGDTIIFDKNESVTSGVINVPDLIFDENLTNIGGSLPLDSGDSLTVKLTRQATSWRMRVY